MFEVKENDGSVSGNWMVVDEDDFAWGGYDTQEDAQEDADKFQANEDAKEYVRCVLFNQLLSPAGNDVLAGLIQNDVRELIREVADEGDH